MLKFVQDDLKLMSHELPASALSNECGCENNLKIKFQILKILIALNVFLIETQCFIPSSTIYIHAILSSEHIRTLSFYSSSKDIPRTDRGICCLKQICLTSVNKTLWFNVNTNQQHSSHGLILQAAIHSEALSQPS